LADASTVVGHTRAFGLAEVWRQVSGLNWNADALICAVGLAAVIAVIDRGRSDPDPAFLTVCLYLGGALLISPMSEVHHLAALVPGLALLTYRALTGASPVVSRVALAAVLLALAGM